LLSAEMISFLKQLVNRLTNSHLAVNTG